MRAWTEFLLIFNSFAGWVPERDRNRCFCEKNNHRRKGNSSSNSKTKRTTSAARKGSGGGLPHVMIIRTILRILSTLVLLVRRKLGLIRKRIAEYQPVRYKECPYSPLSENRLLSVRRKVMVLDLDETLIHSHHDDYAHPLLHPDFLVAVAINNRLVKFFVYKRPHVDFFLSIVSQWYDLVIFTASMQRYGMEVANHLDQNKGILPRRYFRQDCTVDMAGYTKDLSMVSADLSNIFILDNSPAAYRVNPDNAIPIKSWFSDPSDTALLDLLPFLDALRFTQDVRSVLSRNLHEHNLS